MHTLQEFVVNSVMPAMDQLAAAKQVDNLPTTRGAYASVFESFLWLHLGTEVGVFPPRPSLSIASSYYRSFFQSLHAKQDKTLDEEQFRRRLYVVDTTESKELKATFPDFTVLIEQAMRGQDALKAQRNEFHDPSSLRPLFRNYLRLATILAFDPLVRRFTNISQFTDAVAWEAEWQGGDCGPEEVAGAGEIQGLKARSPAVISAGFLRLWSYSHQLAQMSEMYEGEEIRSEDRFKFIDRIKSILRWRINLRSAEVANRFETVRNQLKGHLDSQAKEAENLASAVDLIKHSFDSVFEFWMVYERAAV